MPRSGADAGRRLSVGADPLAGESLPGFVMRVAHRARFRTADRLAGMAGLRQPGSAVTADDLRSLASLIGTAPALVEAIAYRPSPRRGHHFFLGGTLNREFLHLGHRRACPECLAESAHHRSRWDFALATACAEHGVRLADRCQECGRRLGWSLADLTACHCGADLRQAAGKPVRAAEALGNREVLELAGSGHVPWLPTPLAGCDRADLVRALMCLGMFITDWGRHRRIETLVAAGQDSTVNVVCVGVGALKDWPFSVHRFLDAQVAGAGARRGRYGARKTLGAFYDWLTLMEKGAVKDALAAAAAGYVARDAALDRRTHRSLLLARDAPGSFVGLNEAADLLGVSGGGVKRMMAAGMLPGAASEGRGVPMLIDRAAAEALAEAMHGTLDLAGAAAALGISRARLRRLVEGGVLSPLHRASADGRGKWAFPPDEIRSLLAKVSAGAGAGSGGACMVGFETVAEALRRREVGLAEAVAMIAGGRLRAASLDGAAVGLKRLRFAASDVRRLCRDLEGGERLTVQAAAERLGLKWQVVANLVGRGMLATRDGGIAAADVDGFADGHVAGGVLARRRGTSPTALARTLAARGVTPVVGPDVDGSRQNIYRVGDVSV